MTWKTENWIVMLTLNCRALTELALAPVWAQDIPVRLIIIDASSDDGTAEWIRAGWQSEGKPYATLITLPRTAGVSKAWNVALNHIFIYCKAEHALVINNDVQLRPDTYRRLLEDGSPFVTAVGSSTAGTQYPGGEPTMARRPHPDFSCFLIRRECWDRTGQFDEHMKIYVSDLDYHIRMHHVFINACCIDLPFLHYASGTLKQSEEPERERILKQAEQDRMTFTNKWGVAPGSPEYYRLFGHGSPEEGR